MNTIMQGIDWAIVAGFFVVYLGVGLLVARRAGKSAEEYFASGRAMPWWLLGVSMVATTFSTDTPNLVADIVRQNGVAGNWVWWAFLLTGMLTVFIYAKLWRRSGILTDLEFYELRYSGKAAAFLRGFRALYLGVFFNVIVMATVSLAMIKIGGVLLHLTPIQTLLIASLVTVIYSALGGLRSVILTDFLQFMVAMVGSIAAAVIAVNLPQVGGLSGLLSHTNVISKIDFFPDPGNFDALLTLLILPLAVQWWSVWYPGSEPGGGGYIAQRMLAAKNETHAIGATLLFNAAHYALRPWPWILVALCSLIIFPDLEALRTAFPQVDAAVVKDDLAYPAMLTFLPAGLLGVVVASLIAAFMSTISTHLNWGASYVVHDFYKRFIRPAASEAATVFAGRLTTVLLMIVAGFVALLLSNAMQAFNILLQIGAGTGLLFILRWFWWRVNPFSEITAMVVSFLVAVYFQFAHPLTGLPALSTAMMLLCGVAITTLAWVLVTLLTQPSDAETLRNFCRLVGPGGPGWKEITSEMGQDKAGTAWEVPYGILCMALGCVAVYAALFAVGNIIYGNYGIAVGLAAVAIVAVLLIFKYWSRLRAG